MGAAAAHNLAAQGARIVVAARRADRLKALVADIIRSGGNAVAVATDVTKLDDMQRLVDTTVQSYGASTCSSIMLA